MKETLTTLITSPVYKRQSDTTKINIIRGTVQGFRTAARFALLKKFPELEAAFAQLMAKTGGRLLPEGEELPFDFTQNPLELPDFLQAPE